MSLKLLCRKYKHISIQRNYFVKPKMSIFLENGVYYVKLCQIYRYFL